MTTCTATAHYDRGDLDLYCDAEAAPGHIHHFVPADGAPVKPRRYTRWELARLREGAEVRAEVGEVIPELDAMLADAEAQHAEGYMAPETSQAGPADAERPTGGGGNGSSNYSSNRNAPSDKQLGFLASLHRELGTPIPTPRDKNHASLLIDQAKKAVDALRAQPRTWTGTGIEGRPVRPATPSRPATERQKELIANLFTERVFAEDVDVDALDPKSASELIDRLLAAPRAAKAAHGIREGYYAYSTDGGTTADHYHVRRSGRIVVWTAGGEHPYNGKLNEGLEWIKAHPREAAELFGRLIGTCGRCGRVLSDDESRARGIGPVCASKTDW